MKARLSSRTGSSGCSSDGLIEVALGFDGGGAVAFLGDGFPGKSEIAGVAGGERPAACGADWMAAIAASPTLALGAVEACVCACDGCDCGGKRTSRAAAPVCKLCSGIIGNLRMR